jgi:hypothetical protein
LSICRRAAATCATPLPGELELTRVLFAVQGYIKAYIMHSKRLLVLQKGPAVGFPPIAAVNP